MIVGVIGTGVVSTLTSIQGFATSLVSLGIPAGGVRDLSIAEANGNKKEIALIIESINISGIVLGAIGYITLSAFSGIISRVSFGNESYRGDIEILGIAVACMNMLASDMAIMQGLRKISYIAKTTALGSVLGSISSVVYVSRFEANGIAGSLVCFALTQAIVSRFFKIKSLKETDVGVVSWTIDDLASGIYRIFKGSIVLLWSGILSTAVVYATAMIVNRSEGVDAVGTYSAGFFIAGVFANFVLAAMGVEYLPRISQVANDEITLNGMLNQQTQMALLIVAPALSVTIWLAPYILDSLFTAEFSGALDLIKYFAVGFFLKTLSWALGFSMIARKRHLLYGVMETIWHLSHITLVGIFVYFFGVNGVAMGFACAYIIVFVSVYSLVKTDTGFVFSDGTQLFVLGTLLLLCLQILVSYVEEYGVATALQLLISTTILFLVFKQLRAMSENFDGDLT